MKRLLLMLLAWPVALAGQDTLRLELSWDTLPGVASYDWEIRTPDSSVASGVTTVPSVTHLLPRRRQCVTGRARATDIGYSSPPAWGTSDTVCVQVAPDPPPAPFVRLDTIPARPPAAGLVASNDWEGLTTADLPALRIFWNTVNGVANYQAPVDSGNVEIVTDPAGMFGNVVRIRQNPEGENFSTPQGTVALPVACFECWLRVYMAFGPGYGGGQYKMMFLRGHLRIQGDSGGEGRTYGVPNYFGYPPADRTDGSEGTWHLGYVDTEWDDGRWQELVLYADLRTVPVRFGAWRRDLPGGPWKHLVVEYDRTYGGAGVTEVWMGANINRRPVDGPQWVYWGRFDVWEGGDPFGLLYFFDRL